VQHEPPEGGHRAALEARHAHHPISDPLRSLSMVERRQKTTRRSLDSIIGAARAGDSITITHLPGLGAVATPSPRAPMQEVNVTLCIEASLANALYADISGALPWPIKVCPTH
jgi:hypothetical protein